jgi:hypothetical protein
VSGFAYATRETHVFGVVPEINNWAATTWTFEKVDDEGEGGECVD